MAVKDAILAILTLGSAYGLQLRDELVTRAPHRAGLNVGQVYSTLDRLGQAGLITSDELTDDNLPLYVLTPAGRRAAAHWLAIPTPPDVKNWLDMADQVLIASSLPGTAWRGVISRQISSWTSLTDVVSSVPEDAPGALQSVLAERATQQIARAAVEWLTVTHAQLTSAGDSAVPLRSIRPQRGRRPGPLSRP